MGIGEEYNGASATIIACMDHKRRYNGLYIVAAEKAELVVRLGNMELARVAKKARVDIEDDDATVARVLEPSLTPATVASPVRKHIADVVSREIDDRIADVVSREVSDRMAIELAKLKAQGSIKQFHFRNAGTQQGVVGPQLKVEVKNPGRDVSAYQEVVVDASSDEVSALDDSEPPTPLPRQPSQTSIRYDEMARQPVASKMMELDSLFPEVPNVEQNNTTTKNDVPETDTEREQRIQTLTQTKLNVYMNSPRPIETPQGNVKIPDVTTIFPKLPDNLDPASDDQKSHHDIDSKALE